MPINIIVSTVFETENIKRKSLALTESMSDDGTWVLTVEYSEDGEIVEMIDLSPAPKWEETKNILKEKYPEFCFWGDSD